jgi:hypothetical protein
MGRLYDLAPACIVPNIKTTKKGDIPMFKRISNSWQLVTASAKVLKADKELMVFPIISAVGVLIISVTFFVPMVLTNFLDSLFSERLQAFSFIVMFLFYIVQYTVIFFANTALVGAALIRLRGGDPTVADGVRIASQRFVPILGYALISATVGMILRSLSNKTESGIGRIVINIIGMGWNIATYLVVPILAVENVGPIQAIKRSVELLKKTWGEQIAGNLGLGAFFGLVSFLIIASGGGLIFVLAINQVHFAFLIALAILVVLALVLVGLINSTFNGIYTAAVYQYAIDGETGGFFDPETIQNAFRNR